MRPHLEYANQVWAPMYKRQETIIENVQRRATKLVPGLKDLSFEDRLRSLGLPTLKYRRLRGDMIEMFKILRSQYDARVANFIKLHNSDNVTRGHQYKLRKEYIRTSKRKNSFVCRSLNMWNGLQSSVVNAPTVQAFETRLDKHWLLEPFKYCIDEDHPSTYRKYYLEPTGEDFNSLQSDNVM